MQALNTSPLKENDNPCFTLDVTGNETFLVYGGSLE